MGSPPSSPPVAEPRVGREGSRWFNVRPTAEEFAEWCKENIPLHSGLEIKRYIPGITLISQGEKEKVILAWNGPKPTKEDVWHEVYTPYPKVETRVLYWNDWLRLGGEGEGDDKQDYFGVIQPVKPPEADKRMPSGFWSTAFGNTHFVCCTMEAIVYDRKSVKREKILFDKRTGEQRYVFVGDEIFRFTPATKQVPVMREGRSGAVADENAVMKVETGAIGRALGLAGMLMVPGAGIASAEDIQEAIANPVAAATQTALPMEVSDDRPAEEQIADLKARAQRLLDQLNQEKPQLVGDFQTWAGQRGIGSFEEADFGSLKTTVKKLEQMLAE